VENVRGRKIKHKEELIRSKKKNYRHEGRRKKKKENSASISLLWSSVMTHYNSDARYYQENITRITKKESSPKGRRCI
jgi:hypothetical protein